MQVRIGILGAARIAPAALIRPARAVAEAEVVTVAARDPERARRFAAKHGIPAVHDTYDDVLADPGVDAVYIPLPNGLHGEWTLRALQAGKHVLCEKPFTANAPEAEDVAAAAAGSDRVVMEAFHWRYHPLATRVRELLDDGAVGDVRRIEAALCFPLPRPGDIRYDYGLAGGATMDVGCYTIHQLRFLAGAEPTVTSARAKLARPQVDRAMTAELAFDDGRTAKIACSLLSARLVQASWRIVGDGGEIRVLNPSGPHIYNRVTVKTPAGTTRERVPGEATYTFQLRAFTAAVLRGEAFPTTAEDAVANMRVIDDVYRAAGLNVRGT